MILFYSSDGNPLFKKDILSVLSLPTNQSVHFRYTKDIVLSNLLDGLHQLIGRDALIVYVKDNDMSKPAKQRSVQLFPVRKAIIRSTRIDKQTQLVHFGLELMEFVKCEVDYPSDLHMAPPYQFVSHADLKKLEFISWYEKIEELVKFDRSFENHLFYYVEIKQTLNGYKQPVDPGFDSDEEAGYLRVCEGKPYQLDLSIYISETNPENYEKYECKLEYNQKDFIISNPSNINIGTQRDNRRYKLVTKNIDSVRSFDYLKIIAQKTNGSANTQLYETLLRFQIRKSFKKAGLFVLYILISVGGTVIIANAKNKAGELIFQQILGGLVMAVVSALGLYYHFNKRS
jgi:hypothetical protein